MPVFSEIRRTLGQNFKLDKISFLMGNGCSIYAGSKSTLTFNIENAVDKKEIYKIIDVVDKIRGCTLEEQLNALLTAQDFFRLIGEEKEKTIKAIIDSLKQFLLKNYVNSVNYDKLNLHEVMLLKLRSFGCLSKVDLYTPNYDLALEYILDKLSIEYTDGFSGFTNRKYNPSTLHTNKLTRLIKLHGSVNWVYDETDKIIKEIQPVFKNGKIMIPKAEHVLIYPTSQKLCQTYNAPYSELMRSMLNTFESNRNVIIVIGYKYGDEHINEILLKAVANPDNIFYFFNYGNGTSFFIKKMAELSKSINNINIFIGKFLSDFKTFVNYLLPANAEKTDEEKIFELLNRVMVKNAE